jgi:hypothetical protein
MSAALVISLLDSAKPTMQAATAVPRNNTDCIEASRPTK